MAPSTPKNMAQAMDVKRSIIAESSIASWLPLNIDIRKTMTAGKYPSMGMDCNRSMNGMRIREAILLVEARMPKPMPQTREIARVSVILMSVLKV